MLKRVLLALSILIIFLPIIQAQTIQVDYSSQVQVNEEFDFYLKLEGFSDGVYDIKIDITGDERISQIYNDGWKSTFNYVNDIISVAGGNGEGDFKMKIIKDFSGEARIDIKIRNSLESVKVFGNYTIDVEAEEKIEEEDEREVESNEENDEEAEIDEPETIEKINYEDTQIYQEMQVSEKDLRSWKSKSQSIKEYSLYGFTLFCVLTFILLLTWQKSKHQ